MILLWLRKAVKLLTKITCSIARALLDEARMRREQRDLSRSFCCFAFASHREIAITAGQVGVAQRQVISYSAGGRRDTFSDAFEWTTDGSCTPNPLRSDKAELPLDGMLPPLI